MTHTDESIHPGGAPGDSYEVVVVGAGPVGMTAGLELGTRGIRTLVVDPSPSTTDNPRCNTTNARSMEYFRRLGVADTIRRAGLPLDFPTDVVYVTSLLGHELTRIPFSSSQQVLDGTAVEFEEWPTPEPQHRISQIYLEPVLQSRLEQLPSVDLRRGWRATAVRQTEDEVEVDLEQVETGESKTVRAAYLAGCDGGSSTVRRSIGARLEGDSKAASERLSVYFRSPELGMQLARDPGWMYWWFGPHLHGSFVQLNGTDLFLCHARVPQGMDPADLDPDDVLRAAVGAEVPYETVQIVRWTPRRLVADHFVEGRIALAGDAGHLWLPLGGFGMNTGIADAVGLGWRLAAIVRGEGGDRLLQDYESERRSIGEATSRAALKIDQDMQGVGREDSLDSDTPAGQALRDEVGALIQRVDRQQWFSQGVQFGARYAESDGLIGSAATEGAIQAIDSYTPEVLAGARLPHIWLDGPTSLFDLLGRDWTLLRVGDAASDATDDDVRPAAPRLDVVEIPETDVFTTGWVLVRPDLYIAWSGPALPADFRRALAQLMDADHAREHAEDLTPLPA